MKKPRLPRAIQDPDGADVPLKMWSKQSLRREDWDFSGLKEFPHEMLRVAWLYEADRELGSGNPSYLEAWELQELKKRKAKLLADIDGTHRLSVQELEALLPVIPPDKSEAEAEASLEQMLKPDMTIAESDEYLKRLFALDGAKSRKLENLLRSEAKAIKTAWKPPAPKEPEPILVAHSYEGLSKKIPVLHDWNYQWASGEGYDSTIHPLEIDWTLTETELVKAFRNWLLHGDHAPFHPSYKRMATESKVGKRKTFGWLAWLGELAIYRISEAGFTHAEGLEKLNVKPIGREKRRAISAANWEHAQARTRQRIEKEKRRCEHSAWNQGAGSPENWQDDFVKPFPL